MATRTAMMEMELVTDWRKAWRWGRSSGGSQRMIGELIEGAYQNGYELTLPKARPSAGFSK